MSKKAGTATNIILEFIASKLWDIAGLFLMAAIIYLFFILFYSNMVMYLNFFQKSSGLLQFGYLFLGLVFTAIFFLYALLILVLLLSTVLSFLSSMLNSSSNGFIAKNVEKVKKQPVVTTISNTLSGIGNLFKLPTTGNTFRKRFLVLGSLVAFYYSWSIYPIKRSLRGLDYNFLSNAYMETSRTAYITVKPYVTWAMNWTEKYFKIAYDYVIANFPGLV